MICAVTGSARRSSRSPTTASWAISSRSPRSHAEFKLLEMVLRPQMNTGLGDRRAEMIEPVAREVSPSDKAVRPHRRGHRPRGALSARDRPPHGRARPHGDRHPRRTAAAGRRGLCRSGRECWPRPAPLTPHHVGEQLAVLRSCSQVRHGGAAALLVPFASGTDLGCFCLDGAGRRGPTPERRRRLAVRDGGTDSTAGRSS